MSFTEDQITRYSRHILLPEVGGKGQKKLSQAKVFVVGAGGLGCPVAYYLGTAHGLYCPLMLQQAGHTPQSSAEELDHFCQTAKEADKNVELHTFAEASPGFWYPNSPNYRATDLDTALEKSLEFLSPLIKKA